MAISKKKKKKETKHNSHKKYVKPLVLISCSVSQLSLVQGWRLTDYRYRTHLFRGMSSSSFGRVHWKLGSWSPACRWGLSFPSCCHRIECVAVSAFPVSTKIARSSEWCFCRKFHSAKKSNMSASKLSWKLISFVVRKALRIPADVFSKWVIVRLDIDWNVQFSVTFLEIK